MKKLKIILLFLSLCFIGANAQQGIAVSGRVTDNASGEPLPGASVFVKQDPAKGTVTDMDGKYTLQGVPEKGVIVFSYLGMVTKEVPVNGRTIINASLDDDVQLLDEMVIIGYGTQKARDLTAPISVVKQEVIERQLTANIGQALQGKVAGVQVINSGEPGAGATIRVRGVGSVGEYTKPLYVVDGVFTDDINFIGNQDIESITILKDASASAIYGMRAANGVIIVTTRKGAGGKPRVTYDGYMGVQKAVNVLPMANTEEYITVVNEAGWNERDQYYLDGFPKNIADYHGADTDWYGELLRDDATMYSHSLDVSGSSDKSNYSLGASYLFQDGMVIGKNDYQRFNLRGNADFTLSNHIKAGFSLLLSKYDRYKPDNNAFFQAFINPPIYNVYDPDNTDAYPVQFGSPQSVGLGNSYGNPYATAYYNDNMETGYHIVPTFFLELKFLNDRLRFKSQYSQDMVFARTRVYKLSHFVGGSQGLKESQTTKTFSEQVRLVWDNTVSFNDNIDKHNYGLMLGNSVRQDFNTWLLGQSQKSPDYRDQVKYITNGSKLNRNANDGAEKQREASFFARGTYNYDGKYLATLTMRADGSSKYQQRWGYFPSVGLAWVPTSEEFISNLNLKALDFLKLRGSWGRLGNNNVPGNSSFITGGIEASSSGVFGDKLVDGVRAQTVERNYIKWEEVVEFDVGLDFALFKNRLSGTVDLYDRETRNMVFSVPIAAGGGTAELLNNNGSVRNRGIEVTIDWTHRLSGDFSYNTGFNLTTIENEVTEVMGRPDGMVPGEDVNGMYATYAQVGKPIGGFYGYQVDGIYQSWEDIEYTGLPQVDGSLRFRDVSGPDGEPDEKIDQNDVVYLGSPIPKLIGGFHLGLNYKNVDFSISLQGQWGNKILNRKRLKREIFSDANYDKDYVENRWTEDNPDAIYPGARAMNQSISNKVNSLWVEDGSYIRIDNIQLGYTVPRDLLKAFDLPLLRFYVSAQRPITWFRYNGFTPEVGGEPNKSGIDNAVYPMQSVYSFGLKAVF